MYVPLLTKPLHHSHCTASYLIIMREERTSIRTGRKKRHIGEGERPIDRERERERERLYLRYVKCTVRVSLKCNLSSY